MNQSRSVPEVELAKSGLQNQNDSLRARLRMVTNQYNLSELARRTGVSKSNVHRYLNSARIPGDWLASVITEFGINPSWLMIGQGEMLQSEVSKEAGQESAKLLELAVKLNAVGHERLSALQGRRPAQLVRELSEALKREDELRARLRAQVAPVFDSLILEYSQLIRDMRFDETREVLAALRQLERLAGDPDMSAHLDAHEAHEQDYRGNHARARELENRVLGFCIGAGRFRDSSTMRIAYNMCGSLGIRGYYHEAARLAGAMLLLADGDPPRWEEDWLLRIPQAVLDLQDGEPARGLAMLTRMAAAKMPNTATIVQDMLLRWSYVTGIVSFEEVLLRRSDNPSFPGALALMAVWERDIAAIKRMRDACAKMKLRPDVRSAAWMEIIDAILAGKVPATVHSAKPLGAFEGAVLRCEAARFSGRKRIATAAFRESGEALAALDLGQSPSFMLRALRVRQAFDYGDKDEAAQFVLTSLRQGYGCLRTLADDHGLSTVSPGETSWE